MNIVAKIVRGDDFRKTRLHDEKGDFIELRSLPNIPRAILSFILNKIFSYQPYLPWISYNAIKRIEELIKPDWKVIEFGSGMSTIWFVKRCSFVYSIEHNEDWYNKISNLLKKKKLTNVKYYLRKADNSYSDLSEYKDQFFDFCLVDGINRLSCVENVIQKIKVGGFLYLDNSDVHRDPERQRAEEIILDAAKDRNGTVEYFIDFCPTQIHANEGMLAML